MRSQTYHGARNAGIRRRPRAARRRRGWAPARAAVAAAGIAAVAMAALRRADAFRLAVEGGSMAPALEPGDWLVVLGAARVGLGSIVVAEHPDRPGFELVKRVAGLPGDVVEGRTLGPDELWLVGDRAEASTDSRSFGAVPRACVRGVVAFRYWPAARFGPV